MKRLSIILASLFLVAGCGGMKISKPILKMMLKQTNTVSAAPAYADTLKHSIGVAYVESGSPYQVFDIYYADPSVRKDAVLIDIHGGFYVAGRRENNRGFASVFLKEGYDVVLVEYRHSDGKLDVSHELEDCAAALDYLTVNATKLGLNKDRMFLTGDSAGGHLALYMGEGTCDTSVPIRPTKFKTQGVLLSCPAYDFASFAQAKGLTKSAIKWFVGPRYEDKQWLLDVSPKTYIASYTGPLFVSTCTNDFIRSQSLLIKADRDAKGLNLEFVDIESDDKKVAHVHNVINQTLPESMRVNAKMVEFMDKCLEARK